MSYQKDVFSLVSNLSGSDNILAVPRLFCKMTGSLESGIFLSQLLYWSDKGNDPDGWFYKSLEEWSEETFLSEYHVRRSTKLFQDAGFLRTELRKVGNAPKVHYKIDRLNFSEWIMKNFRMDSEKFKSPLLKISESYNKETKNTTKNTYTTTIGTHRDHSDRGGGGSSTRSLPIAAADLKPAVKAQTQTTTAPQQTDPRRAAQIALIAEIIADRLPSWNGHQTYAAGLSTLDGWRLLTWLWAFDQLARAAESNAYDPDAIREAERIERDYGRIFTGIDNPPGFIRAKVRSGESTHLNAADAAELEETIVARTENAVNA